MFAARQMSYTDVSEHQWMIEDHARTSAYEEALRRVVRPTDTVLDFGCGLGVMAILAAKAGAKKVYAVDRLPIIRLARAIALKNNLPDIDFVFAPHDDFELPEKVDVIVSEWMGHFALHEGMLEHLCAARNRHLVPGGRIIPESVTLKAALVTEKSFYDKRCFFQTTPHGIDFTPAMPWVFSELSNEDFRERDLLSPSVVMAHLELATIERSPGFVEAELTPDTASVVYGIAGWFDAKLGQGIELDTGPAVSATHWQHLFFPFAEPWSVDPSRPVKLRMTPVQLDDTRTRWKWWAGDGVTERSGDDLMWQAYLRRPLDAGLVK